MPQIRYARDQRCSPNKEVRMAISGALPTILCGEIVDDTQVLLAHFQDSDGNPLYISEVRDWKG
jgi:hypothetical protein